MEEINKLFNGDEVILKYPTTDIINIGFVLKGTEWEAKDDTKKIEVIWHPSGMKEIISANKVNLMNRVLIAGNTVSKYENGKPVGPLGYCDNVNVYTNVHIVSTSKMIPHVCAADFNYTTAFQVGYTVIFNMWIGEIFDVIKTVTFTSEDGSIFEINDPFTEHFISLNLNCNFSIDNSVFQNFYAGQQLKMCLDAVKSAKFLKNSSDMDNILTEYKNKRCNKWVKVCAQHVEVTSVEVKWCPQQCPATYALGTNMPPKLFTKNDVEKLKALSSRAIHLGDTFSYDIKDNDQLIEISDWQSVHSEVSGVNPDGSPQFEIKNQQIYNGIGSNSLHELKTNKLKVKPFGRNVCDTPQRVRVPKVAIDFSTKVLVEVMNTKTLVDVVWADGTRSVGIESTDLYALQDDTYSVKYKVGVFVFLENLDNPDSCVYGVIQSVRDMERTSKVRVQWFNMEGNSRKVTIIPEITNESIQELRYHPMYNLKFGTLVVDFEEVPEPDEIFTIGKVMCAEKDGKILVTWSDGKTGKHWPQKLIVIKSGFTYQHVYRDNFVHSEWLISKPNCSRAMTSIEEIEKCLLDLLKEGNEGIRTLTKCVYFTVPSTDLLDELEGAIELIMRGFYVVPFFACDEFFADLEKLYKSIIQLVVQTIETAYQRFYGPKQDIDEFKDIIDNLFLRLTSTISKYTNKIEEILVKYLLIDQEENRSQ